MRDRRNAALPPPSGRSRIGTGRTLFLHGVDGRSLIARRYREVLAQLLSDIGKAPSEAQVQIGRRAAAISVWAEAIEAQLAAGHPIDIGAFTTASNTMRRLLADLPSQKDLNETTLDGAEPLILQIVQSDGNGNLRPVFPQENETCEK